MQINTIAKLARKLYVKMQIEEVLPLEKYEIFVKPDFDSASWRFYNGKHQIVIGSHIFDKMVIEGSNKDKALYVRSFLYHELAHSIWTDKDLNAIHEKLKALKISFSMFNLFEDARIEEKMRYHINKKFNWLKYETIGVAQNPIDIFYYLIQAEHNEKIISSIGINIGPGIEHHFDTVKLFYKKAIKCETQEEMIGLLKKWYDRFPNTPKYEEENILKSFIYSSESKYLDEKSFNELIEGLDNLLVGGVKDSGSQKGDKAETKTLGIKLRKAPNRDSLLAPQALSVAFETKTRDVLLKKMQKIFLSPTRVNATRIPSKRINIKNLVAKNPKIFKRKENLGFVKKSITIVLDLSGSMYLTMENMRLILDVLEKMVLKNLLDVTLILSGVSNSCQLYEKYTLPLKEGILERIVPDFEAEGLHNAMSSNLNVLKSSDYVWIFTDGMICEGPIDKKFYHNHHIKTHAFYIGDDDYKKELEISFDYVICERNVINLTNKIFTLVK